ncbi:hypothetical protein [Burkholderia seminalis]|uniref:hypothetical protein n=1 Tax=Burkholderia seminalis TaxID=488731 RepID=UPI001588FA62|nr:hypothetical protein [Burkholderia seminalis]
MKKSRAVGLCFLILGGALGARVSCAGNFTSVSTTSQLPVGQDFSLNTTCPSGSSLVGGGYSLAQTSNTIAVTDANKAAYAAAAASITENSAASNSWRVSGRTMVATNVEVTAICATQ